MALGMWDFFLYFWICGSIRPKNIYPLKIQLHIKPPTTLILDIPIMWYVVIFWESLIFVGGGVLLLLMLADFRAMQQKKSEQQYVALCNCCAQPLT